MCLLLCGPLSMPLLPLFALPGAHVQVYSEIHSPVSFVNPSFSPSPALPKVFFFLWADHSLLCITPPGVPVLYPLLLDNELFQGRARVFEVLYTPIVPNTGKEGQAPTKCILAKCFLSELIWLLNALMVICWTCTMYSSMLSIISFKHHQ